MFWVFLMSVLAVVLIILGIILESGIAIFMGALLVVIGYIIISGDKYSQ